LKLREIDRLIAERIFGIKPCKEWKQVSLGSAGGPALMHGDWTNPVKHDYECYPDIKEFPAMQGTLGGPAKYTTDIVAAWQLVDKMHERGFSTLVLRDAQDSQYQVEMKPAKSKSAKPEAIVFRKPTVQLAICLAALKSCGIDVEVSG
jgi:hypothetical protein